MKTLILLLNTSLVILFAVCFTMTASAQQGEISLEFGGGNTLIDSEYEFVYPSVDYHAAFYQAGVKYTIPTTNKEVNFYSGLTLDKKVLRNDHSEYYLKIPAGFLLHYGNKLKFHMGAGLNFGIHLGEPHAYKRFTLGTFLIAGPSYRITEKYRVMISFQANSDITPIGVEHSYSKVGAVKGPKYNVRGYDGFLSLTVYRKIK